MYEFKVVFSNGDSINIAAWYMTVDSGVAVFSDDCRHNVGVFANYSYILRGSELAVPDDGEGDEDDLYRDMVRSQKFTHSDWSANIVEPVVGLECRVMLNHDPEVDLPAKVCRVGELTVDLSIAGSEAAGFRRDMITLVSLDNI